MSDEKDTHAPARDPGPDRGILEEGAQQKQKWVNSIDFKFTMAAGIHGFGVLRFPYMCFKNGGAVFLIPYFVSILFFGFPMFLLETALGQYTSEGPVTAWRKICPMFEGLGVASQVIVFYVVIYQIVMLAWTIFYLYNAFKTPLPWSTCDNWWNTESCSTVFSMFTNPHLFQPNSSWEFLNNITLPDYDNTTDDSFFMIKTSTEEFWTNHVLRMSDDMSLTTVHWDLAVCLLLAWIMCYFCVWKGIKYTGKLVYLTVTIPYLLLFIIFIRGVTLPGAWQGLLFYLFPDFSKIADLNVWYEAATLVLFSYVSCFGVMTALGSYNKYNNNCYRDCLILCGLNSGTSIFAGLAVFPLLGFMAHELNISVSDVATSGASLVFMTFPRAFLMMPSSAWWTVLIFLLFFLFALNSQFVFVESLATTFTDLFPRYLRRPHAREILVLIIAAVCFLLGLPLVSEGGIILFSLMDNFGPSNISLVIIACCECVVVAWVYGADRFFGNIVDMIGYPPIPVLKYCWLFITPLICVIMLLRSILEKKSIFFYGYVPGSWGPALGSLLVITPLLCIPVFILISLCRNSSNMTTPSKGLRQAQPHKPILTLCKKVIFKAQGQPNRRVDERDEKMVMMEQPGQV